MRTGVRATLLVGLLAVCLYGSPVAAQLPADDVSAHAGMDHGTTHPASPEGSEQYLTVNVDITDAEIHPSVMFVPTGHPVRLVLRNRGTTEHHYRVVGLVPDDLYWVSAADDAQPDGASSSEHNHHSRQLIRERAASPAGIRPSGGEVHAYAPGHRGTDAVFFTATQAGTFVVQCDLHSEHTARLTVFEAAGPPSAARVSSPPLRPALTRALSRDLGSVDYPGAPGVRVDATYATEEYVAQALGGAPAVASLEPDQHVAFMLTERVHTANLPAATEPPDVYVGGSHLPFVDRKVVTDSPHHRAAIYRFARDDSFGTGHQMMTLRLASGQEATWHLPIVVPDLAAGGGGPIGFGEQWGLILAMLGGMLAAMWPCLFQLTVYFIPALAGVAMQDAGASKSSRNRQVLKAAFFFILGFTLLYTATGALIGFAAQRLGETGQLEVWQRYFGVAAGIVVIGLAVRVAAKARAPLVCRMPVLSGMAHSNKPAGRVEMMIAGVAFATGCMTCFGSALVVGMVVYIGLAQSAFYGALVLFLFSLGMGIPLVIAAVAMAKALPFLMKLETAVPWMALISSLIMAGFGALLISGNYMAVAEWTQRFVSGSASLPSAADQLAIAAVVAAGAGFVAWVVWRIRTSPRATAGNA